MRKAHIIQHVPFEDEGLIKEWLFKNHCQVSRSCLYKNIEFPSAYDIDFLIVMGGPMSIHDEEEFPWLTPEKKFIQSVIEQKKKMLGICLGAQLFADVLGGKVKKNSQKEIGWFPVTRVREHSILQGFSKEFQALHWHGETFEIPKGAKQLAKSEACENQAFCYEDYLVGLQFHLETSEEGIKKLIQHCRDEITQGKYIQNEKSLLEGTKENSNKNLIFQLLDNLHQN